jgi:hypothetical protein
MHSMYNSIPIEHGKIKTRTITHRYQYILDPDFFKIPCLRMEYAMTRKLSYLDDLLILTITSFKYHLLKLEIDLARLSIADMRINTSKSNSFQNK